MFVPIGEKLWLNMDQISLITNQMDDAGKIQTFVLHIREDMHVIEYKNRDAYLALCRELLVPRERIKDYNE